MKKIKIAIAIPTYNRLDRLQFCLSKIEGQVIDERFEIYCAISDQESTDGTTEFLDNLRSTKITYLINTQRGYVGTNPKLSSNMLRVAQLIPEDIDWVWFHGDDDYLTSPTVIKELIDFIEKNDDLTLIHACEARRSRHTQEHLKTNLLDLCNLLGYHEMLGWMSNLIVRRNEFVTSIKKSTEVFKYQLNSTGDFLTHRYSAYPHSIAFLEVCHDKLAAFLDTAWIATQDANQTDETLERWKNDHAGIRYFFIIDDLLKLQQKGLFSQKFSLIFFRYHSYSLWDRFANYLIGELVENGSLSDFSLEMLNNVRNITNLLNNTQSQKFFLQWYHGFSHQILEYLQLAKKLQELNQNLRLSYELNNSAAYPEQILGQSG
jgi:glycosyltransferase involved in cell wall biosynthesis